MPALPALIFDQNLFLLEVRIVGLGERVQRASLSPLDGDDDVRLTRPTRMIEIVARWRRRMIRMGVIVADHAKSPTPCVCVSAFGLRRRDQIACLARLLTFVLCGIGFVEKICLARASPDQKAAAFIRVGLLAVFPYLIELFVFSSYCHFVLDLLLEHHLIAGLHGNGVGARVKAIQQSVVMGDDLRCRQQLVVDRRVRVTNQGYIVADADCPA